jgi:signal transduction histidine kinase
MDAAPPAPDYGGVVATRTDLLIAAVCAAWAAVFLADDGAAVALAPLLGLAVLPARRHPVPATLAVSLVIAAIYAGGASEEDQSTLAAGLYVVYTLGRHASGVRGYLPVLALTAALTAPYGAAVVDVVFVMWLLTTTWGCGRLLRLRTERAARAAAVAAELAARDPAVLAARVVAEERARLAGDALGVIRRGVERMREHARAAEAGLDRVPLLAIQDEGRAAVAELRRLLGLLRAEPEPAAPVEPARRRGRPRAKRDAPASPTWRRRRLPGFGRDGASGPAPWGAAAVAGGLMVLALVDAAAWYTDKAPGAIALTLALAATVALIPVDAGLACLAAAIPSILAAAFDAPIAYGFSTALACGVLAWSAGADGRPRTLAALGMLVVVTLLVVRADSPGNEGILLGAFALTGFAGHAYGRRDREGAAALATASRLRSEHEAAAERAVRAERLRLARELHDVASHAVGAMVLQAGAALALRERDRAAAHEALRTVDSAGAEAISELAVLFGLLDAAGLAAPHDERDLGAALTALADRMRAGGLDVRVTVPPDVPADPVLVATAFRIVQEALTNAARYAPGSRVEVALETSGDRLAVTVVDDGGRRGGDLRYDATADDHHRAVPTGGAEALEGGGFGLVGLAERVRALGGDVAAGPAPGGGFAVSARLPTRAGAPA